MTINENKAFIAEVYDMRVRPVLPSESVFLVGEGITVCVRYKVTFITFTNMFRCRCHPL